MSDANRGRTVGKAPAQCAHNVPPESPISAAAATVESASAESVPSFTASQGKEGAPMASTKQACQLDRFRTGNAQQLHSAKQAEHRQDPGTITKSV